MFQYLIMQIEVCIELASAFEEEEDVSSTRLLKLKVRLAPDHDLAVDL